MRKYDVIVVGGGHAGIEASVAAARLGCSTALVTMDKNASGRLSCNPAIGGTAKGHLVREIDALGGVMGEIADKSGIQFRILNRSKGPAVWSPRAQNDRKIYSRVAVEVLDSVQNLEIIAESIVDIKITNGILEGVVTANGEEIAAKAVILSSGTFLNGLMHTGLNATPGGRFGEKPATGITESLIKAGFESGRLKTGTPPRLHRDSINWDILEVQPGDDDPVPFSDRTDKSLFPFLLQVVCHISYTDETVHKILEKGFDRSPMFTGRIQGTGPRYCPSIEDKIVRFADKPRHHLFLEPEGLDSELIYLNGFSSSLPEEIQFEALKKVKGLEEVVMVRPGYAVEYDFFPPHQIDLTMETKRVKGLYFAGQINGTSGYEEAAAQGLMAGINAALKIKGEPEFVLKRSDAYIGVLIDDLVGKSTLEPYRMFTSRAEHRLLLRPDNADIRLSGFGHRIGLITDDELKRVNDKIKKISTGLELANKVKITPDNVNPYLESVGPSPLKFTETLEKVIKRPEVDAFELGKILNTTKNGNGNSTSDKGHSESDKIETGSSHADLNNTNPETRTISEFKRGTIFSSADLNDTNPENRGTVELNRPNTGMNGNEEQNPEAAQTPETKSENPVFDISDKANREEIKNLLSDKEVAFQIELEIKYDGYIQRQKETVARFEKYEELVIPTSINYKNISSLSNESREKLSKVQPRNIGQASRISGVTPSDISILMVYLKK